MKVELFYFESCPSYLKALENAREALRRDAADRAGAAGHQNGCLGLP